MLCRHADRHDSKKGGIVYLLDNTPIDQQKYEITIETGFRKGAGTSAKVRNNKLLTIQLLLLNCLRSYMSHVTRKPVFRASDWSDTKWTVQP